MTILFCEKSNLKCQNYSKSKKFCKSLVVFLKPSNQFYFVIISSHLKIFFRDWWIKKSCNSVMQAAANYFLLFVGNLLSSASVSFVWGASCETPCLIIHIKTFYPEKV